MHANPVRSGGDSKGRQAGHDSVRGEVVRGLWAVSVAVCAALLVASCWLTPERLDGGALVWFGACPARLAGTPCLLCGMSHAFAAMAALRWQAAAQFNVWGPYLFLLATINAAAGLLWAVHWLVHRKRV